MRIRLHEINSNEDLMNVICRFDGILEMLGVKKFRNCNIYITPVDEKGEEENIMLGGIAIKNIHISPTAYSFNDLPLGETLDQNQAPKDVQSRAETIYPKHPLTLH